MSSSIAAITTGTGGVITTADNSGNLNLVSGTTTIVAVTSAGAAVTGTLSSTTGVTLATSSGNVGIGTASPGAALDVSKGATGTVAMKVRNTTSGTGNSAQLSIGMDNDADNLYLKAFSSTFTTAGMNVAAGALINGEGPGGLSVAATQAPIRFYTNGSAAADERMRIDTSGNVGIGTSSGTRKLNVYGGATSTRTMTVTSNASEGLEVGVNASNIATVNSAAGGAIIFTQADTERMRIDSSGRIILQRTAAVNAATLVCSATQNTRAISFVNNNNNNEVGYIFLVNDGVTTQYSTSSDYRLKEAIAPMTGALAKVALLKPCTFKWKINGSDGQGFIAHELQAVVPNCVSGEKDAVNAEGKPVHQGIDTSFLVATLTAAIQELKGIIDTQAAQITALNAKVGI